MTDPGEGSRMRPQPASRPRRAVRCRCRSVDAPHGVRDLDTLCTMHQALTRLRVAFGRDPRRIDETCADESRACSWDAMRSVYEEQAARGVPEARRGLELIEQGRWPSSGRLRER